MSSNPATPLAAGERREQSGYQGQYRVGDALPALLCYEALTNPR
jgi:hypothetical protein